MRRLVAGPAAVASTPVAKGELKWLALYAPLSAVYRVLISIVIVLWIGATSAALGVAAAVFLAVTVVVKPLAGASKRLLESAAPGAQRWKARGTLVSAAAIFAAAVCLVPIPLHTAAPGVVWLPEQAHVRPETDGFVAAVLAQDGASVHPGMLLVRLDDPALHAARAQLTQRVEELESERFGAVRSRDLARAQFLDEDIAKTRRELERTLEKIAQLDVRSGAAGTLVLPRQQDLPGSYARRGASLAYVLNRDDVLVRAAIREQDAALVRSRTQRVGVRIAGISDEDFAGELVRDVPAAARELPSAALGERGGGPYAIDPEDKDGLKTIDPVVMVDLRLPATALERVGSRAWVRFEHGSEPLAGQLYRRARQLLLRHFNPAA
jgi:putative peptide zinc metalloprotease protein